MGPPPLPHTLPAFAAAFLSSSNILPRSRYSRRSGRGACLASAYAVRTGRPTVLSR
jgi:hypothetical protein